MRLHWRWWLLAVILVAVVGGVWVAVTAVKARHDIREIQAQLPTLKADLESGHRAAASSIVASIRSEASDAHSKTTGPAWWVAASVPYFGRPAVVVRDGSLDVNALASGPLPILSNASSSFASGSLRHGHTINLADIAHLQRPTARAAAEIDRVRGSVDSLPSHTWLGSVTRNRNTLVSDVDSLASGLDDLASATRHMPSLLGSGGTRRYLVVFENEAESRGLGGLPGAYAVLTADDGTLHFTRFSTDVGLPAVSAASLHLPRSVVDLYDRSFGFSRTFVNATMSPNFPTDAEVMRAMVSRGLHESIDGVIATDPTALSYLLAVTGPVTNSAGFRLTSANVVSELESQNYAQFSSNAARQAALVSDAQAASDALLSGSGSSFDLARALRMSVDQRRLLVWSASSSAEHWLSSVPLGGSLPHTARPFSAVAVDNGSGTKLDYYLHRTVNYRRTTCASSETETSVTLRSAVPTTPLPDYVTQHAAMPSEPVGYNQLIVFLYATTGSTLSSVTVDGHSVPFDGSIEDGHPVAEITLSMLPRRTYSVSLYAHEPAVAGPLQRVVQPMVNPEVDTQSGPTC